MQLHIEGVEQMQRDLEGGARELYGLIVDAMDGPVGDELLAEARERMSRHRRTGYTERQMRRVRDGNNVLIGIQPDSGDHPVSGMPYQSIGTWIESGTRPHMIPRKGFALLRFEDGGFAMFADHPGFRGRGVMRWSIRTVQPTAEDKLRREVDKRSTMGERV